MLNRRFLCALGVVLLLSATLAHSGPTAAYAAQIDLPIAVYIVQTDDTLPTIAAHFGVRLDAILALNEIANAGDVEVGQELLVPLWSVDLSARDPSPAPPPAVAPPAQADVAPETAEDHSADEAIRLSAGTSSRGETRTEVGLIWPVSGRITQRFKESGHHKGIDISARQGTPILGAQAGVVQLAAFDTSGYGNCVILSHADGSSTLYAHLSGFAVGVGDHVEQGQLVGLVGATGEATGPHLHFEVRQGGGLVDPLSVLP